jgi:hypothetical protein
MQHAPREFSYFLQLCAPNFFQHQAFLHRVHATILQLDRSLASSLPSASFSLSHVQGNSLPEHFHRISLATASPYRNLAEGARHLLAEMVLGLDETRYPRKVYFPVRSISPLETELLFKLAWRSYPLFHSRDIPPSVLETSKHGLSLTFSNPADSTLAHLELHGFAFHKLLQKDGEKANVESPLNKTFVKYAADGVLTSPGGEAKEALELNALCSYWMSSRDRIMNQMVVWEGGQKLGFKDKDDKWGIVLPQVISIGTVTRQANEKTWL